MDASIEPPRLPDAMPLSAVRLAYLSNELKPHLREQYRSCSSVVAHRIAREQRARLSWFERAANYSPEAWADLRAICLGALVISTMITAVLLA